MLGFVLLSACSDYGIREIEGREYPESHPPEIASTEQVDRVHAPNRPPVDILFLVDDSCSMRDDQERLMREVPRLMSGMLREQMDIHVGVTTTGCVPEERCGFVQWLSSDDGVDLVAGASALISVGTMGWSHEEGTRALNMALKREDNAAFFRPAASLHIIAISDEPDGSAPPRPSRFENVLAALSKRVTFSAISRLADEDPVPGECTAIYGATYPKLALAFPGEQVDICADDWSPVMDRIADGFLVWEPRFGLSQRPAPGTLEVTIETAEGVVIVPEEDEWRYDEVANSVVFEEWLIEYVADGTAVLAYEILR